MQSENTAYRFAKASLQYYVTGRWGWLHHQVPVAFIHMHHAVEFGLKARLAKSRNLRELKRMGHDLERLAASAWGGSVPDDVASLLAELKPLWNLRNPDEQMPWGAVIVAGIADIPRLEVPDGASLPQFTASLASADRLFAACIRSAGFNPAALHFGLRPAAMASMILHNPEAAFLFPET